MPVGPAAAGLGVAYTKVLQFIHMDETVERRCLQASMLTSSGTLGSASYTYSGTGLRVKKVSGSTTTLSVNRNGTVVF